MKTCWIQFGPSSVSNSSNKESPASRQGSALPKWESTTTLGHFKLQLLRLVSFPHPFESIWLWCLVVPCRAHVFCKLRTRRSNAFLTATSGAPDVRKSQASHPAPEELQDFPRSLCSLICLAHAGYLHYLSQSNIFLGIPSALYPELHAMEKRQE